MSELSLCVSILADGKKGRKIGRGARGPSVNKLKILCYRGNPILQYSKKGSKKVGKISMLTGLL